MAMFICAACEQLRDSDSGCEEYHHTQLICQQCVDERDEDGDEPEAKHGYTYAEIYETLIRGGCEEDIARELATEKSR